MPDNQLTPRKTSISQLLNPANIAGPSSDSPSRVHLDNVYDDQQTQRYQQQQSPQPHMPSSSNKFHLRAANWDVNGGMEEPMDPHSRSMAASHHLHDHHATHHSPNGRRDGHEDLQAPRPHAYYGNLPHPHSVYPPGMIAYPTMPSSNLQSAERASVRLVARTTVTPPAGYPHQSTHPYPLSVPSSSSQSQHHLQRPQKRSRASTEVEDDVASTSLDAQPGSEAKVKRPRGKTRGIGSDVAIGSAITSKKGPKKRAELVPMSASRITYTQDGIGKAQTSGVNGLVPVGSSDPDAQVFVELQVTRCMSARYKADDFPRCVSCTRRWAGDTCRFQGIRFFMRDQRRNLIGISFVENSNDVPSMSFPSTWNVDLGKKHVRRTMTTVARVLLPHLKKEQDHVKHQDVIRRPRETEVRATCDTCMTSLFFSTWMCRQCGREACEECFDLIKELTDDVSVSTTAEAVAIQVKRDNHGRTNPFFLSCVKRADHKASHFSPVSRFSKEELEDAVTEMDALIEEDEKEKREGVREGGKKELNEGEIKKDAIGNAEDSVMKDSSELVSLPQPTIVENPVPTGVDPLDPTSSASPVPSWPIHYYQDTDLNEEAFSTIWTRGQPIVITNVKSKFEIEWTPGYFIEKYGAQTCMIVDCQRENAQEKVSVSRFFEGFGKRPGGADNVVEGQDVRKEGECWKLKDWPPSQDFKTAFPELYQDFCRAVPVPTYARRDGALNIASHFPHNTVAPDLGPKMYNAFASSDIPNSKGSTRLHMDMADAVNTMVYASPSENGTPGCAAWDIYRSEDSAKIREFLRKWHLSHGGKPAGGTSSSGHSGPGSGNAAAPGQLSHDPIHSQHFYLDPVMRRRLWDEMKVKSWRIYQREGEAVFIPAGCAHQVCNLADCIKVACDFVSPENVERCQNLTKEFRDQNQSHVWKEDVLQLRAMMWFAWLSCRRFSDPANKTQTQGEPMQVEQQKDSQGGQ